MKVRIGLVFEMMAKRISIVLLYVSIVDWILNKSEFHCSLSSFARIELIGLEYRHSIKVKNSPEGKSRLLIDSAFSNGRKGDE